MGIFERFNRKNSSRLPSSHVGAPSIYALALEPRLLFDGAVAATAADALTDPSAATAANGAADALIEAAGAARVEVAFVDTGVADYQTLVAGLAPNVEVVYLDASQDGVQQMAQTLEGRSGIDAIYVISHGSEGEVALGDAFLSENTLAQYADELAVIGGALKADGDLLLFGCNAGGGADGQQFVADLALATGADVAASDDLTGAAALGGDWTLEVAQGSIEDYAIFSDAALRDFSHLLALPNGTQTLPSFTDQGATLTSAATLGASYFVASGKDGNSTITTLDKDATGAYLTVAGGGQFTAGNYLKAAADGTNLATFQLTGISITEYAAQDVFNVTIVGYVSGGGTVSSSTFNGTTGADTFTFDLTAFSGVNLTSFRVNYDSINAAQGSFYSSDADLTLASFTVANAAAPGPTVTDANITIISTGSGTGGAYQIGDTVTAKWNNTGTGDNQSGVTGVTMDFSQFGGGSSVTATNDGSGNWTASYTITSGSIDATSRNVSVTATSGGSGTTTADTTNLTVDNQAPTVADANISISGGTGSGGAYKIGDTVTATWNNTAGGDNNSDTISGATVDFSAFGGGSAVAMTNAAGTWTATYVIVSGAIDGTNKNVSVTATDNAGNTKTTADTGNATVDNIAPTVADGNISISGGTGTGGAYKVGDTVTVTWNNTAGGDSNSDTISGATVDFSAFGGGSAVAMSNNAGTWTATYLIAGGAIDGTNKNVSVTATDNAGNTKTTADTTNATVDNIAPTVTDAKISISGASGTGGAYKIGDTVTVTWNAAAAGGDGNSDTLSSVTADFSAFGGGSAVAMSNSAGTWTATYTITAGSIDGTNKNVSVTATDNAGNTTTTADTSNATVDNMAPTVTDGNISISGASGTGGAYKIGDTVTVTWNNTAGGDSNSDTISGATVDFSAFGGGSAVAMSNSAGTWTATYTITAGSIDGTNKNVSVTATDNAGNTTTTADTTNATVDNQLPTVTDANISISGGTGTGGAYKIGDTVTATWSNTAGGDSNSDTISGATADFSAFGGGSAVAMTNSSGTWTATYTITAGSIDGSNKNVSVTATDNAGNTKTTADTANATVDNQAPTVTDGNISISGASGTGGAYKVGDTVTATWNNTAGGDANSDTISGATVDFSAFGGGSAVAMTNSGGTWTATYMLVAGSINASNLNVSVTATDNAGNTKTTADTTNATVYTIAPTVTDGNIAITSTGSGTGGVYKIGDTVTATWNNSASGDNNGNIASVTMDFSAFGGGSAVAASNNGSGVWTASYTITSGSIDGTNKNVSVTATDNTAGNFRTTADSSNLSVDNQAPTVTDANISISGGTGTGGAYKVGDTVTVTWNNTAGGDNNSDTISGATVDFSAFGGGSAVAMTNSSGTWTATYTITAGSIDGTNKNVSVTATDNAGNTTTTADTTNATVDNIAPTVTDANVSISGASGVGGVYLLGDTVTATWNNTAGGDNNSDTISGATVDFSAFGGGSAVAMTNSGGTWTATYTITGAGTDGTNKNVSVTATDNAGNTKTAADTSNATVDTQPPTVTSISASTANGVYKAGNTISITVTFSENVTVTGTPQLTLETGTTDHVATYSSGSGTNTLTFTYTVQAGETSADLDYLNASALSLNGGTIKDAVGNNATLTLPAPGAANSLGANKAIVIDTTAPSTATGTLSVAENSANGTAVGTVSATDGSGVSYSLADSANGRFAINSSTGAVTVADGSQLNFEANSSHGITVRVTDGAGNTTDTVLTVTVTDANDAPTGVGNASLPAVTEDSSNPSGTAINALTGYAFQDADGGATSPGILVVGNSANASEGEWQYSTDGVNWKAIGTVGDNATALALSSTTQLRFVPAADFSGTPTALSIRALDNTYGGAFSDTTGGTETRVTVDSSANGGSTAIAANTNSVGTSVTAANDAPSFTKGSDQTVNEDAGAQTVTGWATAISQGPASESGQTVSFTVSNDNNALFSMQPSIDANGNLTYTPAADASGTATVTVTLRDDGGTANGGSDGSASQTFTITVNPVNDAPTFSKGADQTAKADAGAQTVAGWATAISAGASDESGQTLTFTVSNDNNALFSVQPSIDADGNLTYTPNPSASGTATVTVLVRDSGGTANSGSDSSASQTFTITINPASGGSAGSPGQTPGTTENTEETSGINLSQMTGNDSNSGASLGSAIGQSQSQQSSPSSEPGTEQAPAGGFVPDNGGSMPSPFGDNSGSGMGGGGSGFAAAASFGVDVAPLGAGAYVFNVTTANASFAVPVDPLSKLDLSEGVRYEAATADGNSLPPAIQFDKNTGVFTVNGAVKGGAVVVKVTVTDAHGKQVTMLLTVRTKMPSDAGKHTGQSGQPRNNAQGIPPRAAVTLPGPGREMAGRWAGDLSGGHHAAKPAFSDQLRQSGFSAQQAALLQSVAEVFGA